MQQSQHPVSGLDSIRFICAVWVALGHLGLPALGVGDSYLLGHLFNGVYNNLISGQAAVIVFFVISGFCIHYAQANSLRLESIPAFYTRRYVRIGIPLFAAILIAIPLKVPFGFFEDSILWSLFAELIYYSLYPLLLHARRSVGSWLPLLGVTFPLALAIAGTDPDARNYPSFGIGLNWLLGLPCWLIGCLIAEKIANTCTAFHVGHIWLWRASVWATSIGCSALRFHSPLGYPWTLNFFAILVGVWLIKEIEHSRRRKPLRVLEWAGSWSYSVYLIHVLVIVALLNVPLSWAIKLLCILAASFLFAVVVEFPSHNIARYWSRRVASWDYLLRMRSDTV